MALGARRSERLQALREEITAEGGTVIASVVDVTDESQSHRFLAEAHAHFGRLDGLVNNAGVMLLGDVEGTDSEEWRRMIEVNLLGLLYCTQAALPIMREQGGGHVVNVSSLAGRQASFGHAVYNLTKFGVCGFSESLRMEAHHANIRVTVVEPGFVDTELHDHTTNQYVIDLTARVREKIGKVLDPQDVARAILYALLQPEHVSVNEILVRATRQRD